MLTPEQARRLTDAELSERASWTRQQIEAIRPYYVRDLHNDRRVCADEFKRRDAARAAAQPSTATEGSAA